MTVLADLNALSLTANAKSTLSTKGTGDAMLIANVRQHVIELQALLKQLISHHPSGGGDAANLSSLNALLAQLN